MGASLRHYALGQIDRTTFDGDETPGCLIAIDNYSPT